MAGATNKKKISANSARAHTRRASRNSSFKLTSGVSSKVLLVLFLGILSWGYQAIRPPPAKICGSPGGPSITGPRIKLRDGRHLAYKEHGVSRDVARYKIMYLHPFGSSCHDPLIGILSPEFVEEFGVYIVSFDRPGYGESDPHPSRTLKSLTEDIEELADQLELKSKFYVIGYSMGGAMTWSCLKYIPHRLAGAVLLTPAINYWWPGFPANLSNEVYGELLPRDQWAYRVGHYAPWLSYWWHTQKWFHCSSVICSIHNILSRQDLEIAATFDTQETLGYARQQGDAESVHREMGIWLGNWEFDPMDLENPFPNGEGHVDLWQGDEDNAVPAKLQRYLVQRLPWIRYHEVSGSGHMFPFIEGLFDKIVKAMLTSE